MLGNFKRFVAVALLLCPLTFLGQINKNLSHVRGNKGKPIVRVKENYNGAPNSFEKSISIVAGVGPAILNADNDLGMKLGYNGNIGLSYQINKTFAVEGTIGYASLDGKYSACTVENINFLEAKINLMVDLTHIVFGPNNYRKINVYPHIGLGQVQSKGEVVYTTTKTHYYIGHGIEGKNNRDGGGFGKRNVALTVPAGVDIAYNVNNYLKLRLDITTNYVDSDLLDVVPFGLSKVLGDSNDWYSTFNVRLQYKLGKIYRKVSACDNVFK